MNRLVQEAVLVGLARRLTQHGSWGGETHLQKATYLLSELRDIDFEFDFILYKHGPFSFELRDELSSMLAEGLVSQHSPSPGYGPKFHVTARGEALESRFQKTMRRYGDALDWIASTLGGRGVKDLEKLATAMWVTRHGAGASVRARATALTHVKPHISLDAAIAGIEEIDQMILETKKPARPAAGRTLGSRRLAPR